MNIEDLAGSRQRRVMHSRVFLTPDYTIEITLYDYEGLFPIEVIWEPMVPDEAEFIRLSPRIEQALTPFYEKVMILSGLIEEVHNGH